MIRRSETLIKKRIHFALNYQSPPSQVDKAGDVEYCQGLKRVKQILIGGQNRMRHHRTGSRTRKSSAEMKNRDVALSGAEHNCVYVHSCQEMSELANESVNLTVTSPPYWNAIDYDVHCTDHSRDYRPRQEVSYDDYLKFLSVCFREILRVHKQGSVCAVVIGTVLLNGSHTPLPFHFVGLMEELGWQFFQDIIWSKCTGGVKRAGSTVQHPFPGYFYPNIMTEYILLFRKPGKCCLYDGRSKKEKEQNRVLLDSVFTKEVANNIWHIAPVPPGQLDHPCPFPEEIPYRILQWFSYRGDLVLDPFCGVGTTPKVAANLGRRWIAYETKKKYAEITMQRVKEPLRLRKQLIVKLEKVAYGTRQPAKNKSRRPFRRRKTSTGTATPKLLEQLTLLDRFGEKEAST